MSDSQRKELNAFFAFFATFDLTRPVASAADLCDGAAFFEVLTLIDSEYFRQPTRPSAQPSENWVLRFGALKRLYRLMTQYFSDVLHQPTNTLDVPDLQAIAKDHNVTAILIMCRLSIAIAVQCEGNKEIIERIQKLSEGEQHSLMKAIEQVMAKVKASAESMGEISMSEDDHFYSLHLDRSRVLTEKETLEKVYQSLLEEHRTLQTNFDDVVSEKEDALAQARQAQRDAENRRSDSRGDNLMRAEMERLRAELQKCEDNLAMTESELDKNTNLVTDLTRKVGELQVRADEATRLKDQIDEYKHAADKLQKTENVMEKYKKKLQEGADLRLQLRGLEKQNSDLVDKNASLEEEYRKVAAFKPLMESYKTQIAELETKASTRSKEVDALRFELEQTKTKLKISMEERAKDSETLELYQERVRELELMSTRPTGPPRNRVAPAETPTGNMTELTEAELNGEPFPTDEDDDDDIQGLGDELDSALAGTTMTDLKLQVRKLQRELEAIQKKEVDASRVLVLENLLEDANRMKTRYEADYLAAHREKLVLQNNLDEIRSGKSMGDGAEAAIALRQRLNETVDDLDALRKAHAELEVKFEAQTKELTIAKSDLNLVNKDQLEILATLRESVNEDKATLETETKRLGDQIKELSDKNKMQLEQINGLLLEKVSLQGEGLDQRDRMLQRERDIGDLRASLSGKNVPEDIKARMLKLHEECVTTQEQLKTTQDKLSKAKTFIKQQDKLFKEEQAKKGITITDGTHEEVESRNKMLEEEVARLQRTLQNTRAQFAREQELLLSIVHEQGQRFARTHLASQTQVPRPEPTAWLGQQRKNLGQILRR